MLLRISLFVIYAICATGLLIPATHEIHEKREALHPRWLKGRRISPQSILPIRVGLTQNLENAEKHLLDISDPNNPNFGQWWSAEDVVEAFKPPDETLEAVKDWLTSSGISVKDRALRLVRLRCHWRVSRISPAHGVL